MEMNVDHGEYVDWRGRSVHPNKHGGKRAAAIVCLIEILENMVFISNASNLVTYFYSYMHYSVAESSNMVTNYMGTCFIITLLGGFISDSFLPRFWSIVIFGIAELFGLIILTIQAREESLRPSAGHRPSSLQAAILYVGIYLMALGVGGVKANLPAHGADQIDQAKKHLISSFFNWFFFCLCTGGMLAVTFLVWVQENEGWQWGLGVCTIALFVFIFIFSTCCRYYKNKVPSGSPLSRIFKVLFYSACNRCISMQTPNMDGPKGKCHNKFRFLEKATFGGHVTSIQVEEAKSFFGLLTIFACTIMMNCCLAQLQTFSVQQGQTMSTALSHDFKIPPASLTAVPLVVMLISVPLYDRINALNMSRLRITPLKRIGVGLMLASVSMAVAALVEVKRRQAATDGTELTVFWLGWQYLLLGVSDMFTLAGMLEFFYSEAPDTMKSLCTSLSWCSTSMGYFLSSVLVAIVNSASRRFGSGAWLGGNDLNKDHLELFYALLAVLNFINFLNYIFWAKWY
ncbi:protein NRT1/ PTR FAMILY 4.2-like [Phoenix dactylifera]|uniref:Protein NRT1/ PTR FAMILY 4.2-like n=1 Tax=Phoenix dactylifera TaxID=42345 RepID=A0A8B8ZT29_PHODC|nr:protein NRT1/ PTR FAMILY 4.2-like [Phoenix dactylifera]